jgi:hypothetical protein
MIHWWTRLRALWRHALKLWENRRMPLTLETMTDDDVALIQRQADVDGEPLDHWVRNRLLGSVTPLTRGQVNPHIRPVLEQMRKGLDAVDLALGEDADEDTIAGHGASTVFGLLPVAVPTDAPPGAPPPPAAPASTMHSRVQGSGQGVGPLATTERVDGHPCSHLARRYLANFTANDCQGTCECKARGGGESVCNWPPGSAQSCSYFSPKRRPVPNQHLMPRQG